MASIKLNSFVEYYVLLTALTDSKIYFKHFKARQ